MFSTQNALARFLIIGVGIFVIFAIFNAWNTSNKRKQAEEFVNQANALLESGNYQEAITLYNQAIELDDSNYEVFYNCGIAYYKEDEFDRAIGSCQAVKLNKSYALAHMCLGDSYSKKGDYQSAYSEYTETIKKDSDNAEAYIKRGVIAYLQFEDYAQAISDFTKVLDINPDATTVLKYRGFAYLNLEQYENAISDFTQYIDSTGDSTMYYTLGDIYYNNSDYKNAIEAYSNGLSFSDETIPEAYLFMAISYEEIGSVEQAIQNYNKYLDLDNGDNERTRYACSQVNSLTLNNSSNIFSFFFNALIPSCSRFRNSDGATIQVMTR
ncbi:MAG: tetratricopeptide repeat protein [Anaerolineales bacterium]|nr:tetratricopeptide repeat protein [Anaerolineales bacterium]